jgi:hypothetical protein
MKGIIRLMSLIGTLAKRIHRKLLPRREKPEPFPGSVAYWEKRYASGGDSGAGSTGLFAEFKAEVLNRFVAMHQVQTVIEFGCGDGNQLRLAQYPAYLGFDVSKTAVSRCRRLFKSDSHKSFRMMSEYDGETADLALSLDVIYHLVEDDVFERYMWTLFKASTRYVIIYASDTDDNRGFEGTHIKHRTFTKWIQENLREWTLVERLPNRYPSRGDSRRGSFAEFAFYETASPPGDRRRA